MKALLALAATAATVAFSVPAAVAYTRIEPTLAPGEQVQATYDPRAYVPGGAPANVARAIQQTARGQVPQTYDPNAYVPGGAPANVASAIQESGRHGVPSLSTSSTRVATSAGGFDWGDASVGAGVAVGSMLVLLTLFAMTRRQRRLAV